MEMRAAVPPRRHRKRYQVWYSREEGTTDKQNDRLGTLNQRLTHKCTTQTFGIVVPFGRIK